MWLACGVKTARLKLSRKKGFSLQAVSLDLNGLPAVNCARPSRWGNPFRIGHDAKDAKDAVEKFQYWLTATNEGLEIFSRCKTELRGKNLACWCKPGEFCHCDTLLEIANK